MSSSAAWSSAQNVLAIRLDTIGDVLMTTPAMRALKESCPGRRLTLLTSKPGAAIAEFIPEIDAVIPYEAPWLKSAALRKDSLPDWDMVRRLRADQFDACVIFTVYSQNPLPAALFSFLADIPLRLAHCRENPYQLLTDWVPEPEPQQFIRHEVRRQLDLVGTVGCQTAEERLSLQVPYRDRQWARRCLGERGIAPGQPWAAVHPGATAASRRYPPERFAAACTELAEGDGWQLVFTGQADEMDLIERIRASIPRPTHSVAGQLSLGQLAGILAEAPLLIANNTGPVHMAAALGTPVVDLYALTNPQHTPWQVPHRVLSFDVPCKFCYRSVCPEGHHDCLRRISPQAVAHAARDLLDETRGARLPLRDMGANDVHSGYQCRIP